MSLNTSNKITLRTVADRVGLAPCSISAVLNNTPASCAIPQATKEKIFRAAAELNYRPNFWARSLRMKRTRMVAAVTADFGRPAIARVTAAAQDMLARNGYLLVLVRISPTDSRQNSMQFQERGIEGLIAIDVDVPRNIDLPAVAVKLDYLTSPELMGNGVHAWLSELGITAAEEIVQQIEVTHSSTGSRQSERMPKPPEAQATSPVATPANAYETRDGV